MIDRNPASKCRQHSLLDEDVKPSVKRMSFSFSPAALHILGRFTSIRPRFSLLSSSVLVVLLPFFQEARVTFESEPRNARFHQERISLISLLGVCVLPIPTPGQTRMAVPLNMHGPELLSPLLTLCQCLCQQLQR